MTDKIDPKGLTIARWANEGTGTLTDSLVYINDIGDIISPAPIQAIGFVLENSDGKTLFLANSEFQEFGIGTLTFPATLGVKNQYLRIQSVSILTDNTILEWADGDGSGTVTQVNTDDINIIGGPIATTGTISLNPILTEITSINTVGFDSNGNIDLGQSSATLGNLVFSTVNGATQIAANPSQIGVLNLVLPNNIGNSGYYLQTDGAGNLDWVPGDGSGTVTSITAGIGLSGGTITTTGTIALANTAVTAGSYTYAGIMVDAQGRLTDAAPGFVNTNGVGNSDTAGFDDLNGITGVVINTTEVNSNSIINVTRNVGSAGLPDVMTIGNLIVGSIVNNSSFTIYSTVDGDIGNINWFIINP